MSWGVSSIGAIAGLPAVSPKADVVKVAHEFEALLVRQLVASAKLGGKEGERGYGAMAVDALSTGVMQGGGLGLARQLEDALSRALGERKPRG